MKYIPLLVFLLACVRANDTRRQIILPVKEDSLTSGKIPEADRARYSKAVTRYVDSVFARDGLNGAILVAKHGQIIYEKYAGYRNPRVAKDSITTTTAFHLASVSKTFTATAILKLWEDGLLNINDSLTKYFPEFPYKGVTIKSMLDHRSGLPKYDHYMEELGWDRRKTVHNQDVLDFIVSHQKKIPVWSPERRFSYSNTNYALLALLVEKVSGMSYPHYMKQTFFDPLEMKDTYVFTEADSARALPSWYHSGRPYRFNYLDLVYGDKNIYCSARDLLKWDQALHNGLLKPETLNAAYTPYSFEKPGIHNYGLGWRMYLLKNDKKLIYHNGWWHGNRPSFVRLIDEDVVIIGLCNDDDKRLYSIKTMADIFGNYLQTNRTREAWEDEEQEGGSH